MGDKIVTIQSLKDQVRQFVIERDWQQFHVPKNLAMAIANEAGELLRPFRWRTNEESEALMRNPDDPVYQEVCEEVADIVILVLSFCIWNNLDLSNLVINKVNKNTAEYPKDKVRGYAEKI